MKAGYSLMWSEGTFLTQQHFQHWEQSLLSQQEKLLDLMMPHAYGVKKLKIDALALTQGRCRIHFLEARLPSGEWIYYDHETMPALFVDLKHHADCLISIVIPNNRYCANLPGYEQSHEQPGYSVAYYHLADLHHPEKEHELGLKRRNIRLSTDTHDGAHETTLVILGLTYAGGQYYRVDNGYIPPCMTVDACAGIVQHRTSVLQLISERSHQLDIWLASKKDQIALMEALILAEAGVTMGWDSQHVHPSVLYRQVNDVLAKLAVLRGVKVWPEEYVHDNLSALCSEQIIILNGLLKDPKHSLENIFVLKRIDEHHHELKHISDESFKDYDWYLGVYYQDSDFTWVERFSKQAKMASPNQMADVLSASLPGIVIMPTSRPPHQILIKSGYEYFKISQTGPFWKAIEREKALIIYMPKPFHDAILTLDRVETDHEKV